MTDPNEEDDSESDDEGYDPYAEADFAWVHNIQEFEDE
jgi:hypothetical protein